MELEKLAPWNWFKKEEEESGQIVPVKRGETHPFSLHEMQREFDRVIDTIRQDFARGWPSLRPERYLGTEWFKPSLDVASDEKEYSIKVELPGIAAEDVTLEVSGSTMKVKGEKKQQSEEKGKDFYRMERSYGAFERVLDLPDDADADKITSHYKDGVLSISIPRKALPKKETKKIEIEVK
jgi:HSP20 family protein